MHHNLCKYWPKQPCILHNMMHNVWLLGADMLLDLVFMAAFQLRTGLLLNEELLHMFFSIHASNNKTYKTNRGSLFFSVFQLRVNVK